MKLILIGDEASKRTFYLKKAAEKIGVFVQIISWDDVGYIFGLNELKNICSSEKKIIYKNIYQRYVLKNTFINEKDKISGEDEIQKQKIKSVDLNEVDLNQKNSLMQKLQDIVLNDTDLTSPNFLMQELQSIVSDDTDLPPKIFLMQELQSIVSDDTDLKQKNFLMQELQGIVLDDTDLKQKNFLMREISDSVSNNKRLEENMFSLLDFKCVDFEGKNILSKEKKNPESLLNSIACNNQDTSLKQKIVNLKELEGAVIKIDPPSYETVQLCEMQKLLNGYQNNLRKMMKVSCRFLNDPEAILKLLDKKETKLQLQSHEVPVTKMFDEDVRNLEQLLELMEKKRCYSVFVKPRYFSGAAGVVAFRVHPRNGNMRVYTSCQMDGDCLVNTKKMVVLEDKQEIASFMEKLLELGCIVERWYPKAEFEGKSYDLRVVYQFGHIAYIVVRQSGGPITNLHLNNHATDIKRLGLSKEKLEEIESVCKKAMEVFFGLNMAGIDIMLEKGTLRPLIIEMNGQGDLIYQDIYEENRIYAEQIEWLMSSGKAINL